MVPEEIYDWLRKEIITKKYIREKLAEPKKENLNGHSFWYLQMKLLILSLKDVLIKL